MKRFAIIVAGGSGSRFGSEIPKQFLLLKGKPVLAHTIEKFHKTDASISIRLVLPAPQISRWKELCTTFNIETPHLIVEGGNSRFQSVKKGLQSILPNEVEPDSVVAIHDGVRPLVEQQVIELSYTKAAELGNAITSVLSKDSVRIVEGKKNKALDRSQIRIIQTPQTFQLSAILKAFQQPESPSFTDDASVAEAAGITIHLIEGSYSNIKITTPEDLTLAELLEH